MKRKLALGFGIVILITCWQIARADHLWIDTSNGKVEIDMYIRELKDYDSYIPDVDSLEILALNNVGTRHNVVLGSRISVWEEPEIGSARLGYVNRFDEVKIIDEVDDFYVVTHGDDLGFVESAFVKEGAEKIFITRMTDIFLEKDFDLLTGRREMEWFWVLRSFGNGTYLIANENTIGYVKKPKFYSESYMEFFWTMPTVSQVNITTDTKVFVEPSEGANYITSLRVGNRCEIIARSGEFWMIRVYNEEFGNMLGYIPVESVL